MPWHRGYYNILVRLGASLTVDTSTNPAGNPIFLSPIFINMIRLTSLLAESGLTDAMHIEGIGQLSCKWDTGADTKASTLHATDIQVDGDTVTWVTHGTRCSAPIRGYSAPQGKDKRVVVHLECEWQGQRIKAPFALTDRSTMSTPVLCNLALMRRLGAIVDLHKGLQ